MAMIFPVGMGGGDAKFAPVFGLTVGFPGTLIAQWLSVMEGVFLAIVLILMRMKIRRDSIPFGPFMTFGVASDLTQTAGYVKRHEDAW